MHVLLHWEFHQVSVQEKPQQEVVDVFQLFRSSHVQHEDSSLGFPTDTAEFQQFTPNYHNRSSTHRTGVVLIQELDNASVPAHDATTLLQ